MLQITNPHVSSKETADNYRSIIAELNAGWRVIECRDGMHWILQRRAFTAKDQWRARACCRTRCGLLQVVHEYVRAPLNADGRSAVPRVV